MVVDQIEDCKIANGIRQLVPVVDGALEALTPYLLDIVSVASKTVGFPLKTPKIVKPLIVVAPKKSKLSNSWTKGGIHRDFDCVETSGVYSFMLFLDEVTAENGAIEFWKDSKLCGPLEKKCPERAINKAGLASEVATGPKAYVMVWDARILHRSLPNKSQNQRLTLQWLVTGVKGPSITVFS